MSKDPKPPQMPTADEPGPHTAFLVKGLEQLHGDVNEATPEIALQAVLLLAQYLDLSHFTEEERAYKAVMQLHGELQETKGEWDALEEALADRERERDEKENDG